MSLNGDDAKLKAKRQKNKGVIKLTHTHTVQFLCKLFNSFIHYLLPLLSIYGRGQLPPYVQVTPVFSNLTLWAQEQLPHLIWNYKIYVQI